MLQAFLTLTNAVGLHARPAAKFVQTAARFASAITVRNVTRGGPPADAKGILGVLTLGAEHGHVIEVAAAGLRRGRKSRRDPGARRVGVWRAAVTARRLTGRAASPGTAAELDVLTETQRARLSPEIVAVFEAQRLMHTRWPRIARTPRWRRWPTGWRRRYSG